MNCITMSPLRVFLVLNGQVLDVYVTIVFRRCSCIDHVDGGLVITASGEKSSL